jgi:hypothetical protein
MNVIWSDSNQIKNNNKIMMTRSESDPTYWHLYMQHILIDSFFYLFSFFLCKLDSYFCHFFINENWWLDLANCKWNMERNGLRSNFVRYLILSHIILFTCLTKCRILRTPIVQCWFEYQINTKDRREQSINVSSCVMLGPFVLDWRIIKNNGPANVVYK